MEHDKKIDFIRVWTVQSNACEDLSVVGASLMEVEGNIVIVALL